MEGLNYPVHSGAKMEDPLPSDYKERVEYLEGHIGFYVGLISNLSMGVLKNEADAIDASQEAIIKIFKNIDKFNGNSSLSTWIYRITMNTAIREKNKSRCKKRGNGGVLSLSTRFVNNEVNMKTSCFMSPRKAYDNKILEGLLNEEIFNTLTNGQIRPFLMYYYDGMSNKDIGNILGVLDTTSRSIIFQARQRLKGNERLKKYFKEL